MSEENKAIVRRYLEAINQGNLAALDHLLSPDYLYHLAPGHSRSYRKVDPVSAMHSPMQ